MERDEDAVVTSMPSYETEAEIDEVILRLDLTLIRPDDQVSGRPQSAEPACSSPSNGTDAGTGAHGDSDTTASESETSSSNGDERAETEKTPAENNTSNGSSSLQQDDDKKRSKPLDFIRKLRQTGQLTDNHHRNGAATDSASKRKSPEPLKVCHARRTIWYSSVESMIISYEHSSDFCRDWNCIIVGTQLELFIKIHRD